MTDIINDMVETNTVPEQQEAQPEETSTEQEQIEVQPDQAEAEPDLSDPDTLKNIIESQKKEIGDLKEDVKGKASYIAAKRKEYKEIEDIARASSISNNPELNELERYYSDAVENASPEERKAIMNQYALEYSKNLQKSTVIADEQAKNKALGDLGRAKFDDWNDVLKASTFGMGKQEELDYAAELSRLGDPDKIYKIASQTASERNPVYKYQRGEKSAKTIVKKVANPPQTSLKSEATPMVKNDFQSNMEAYLKRKGLA